MLPEYFILLSSSNSVAGPIVFLAAVAICIILWRRDKKKKAEAERWRKSEEHEQAAGMKSSIKIPEIHLLERRRTFLGGVQGSLIPITTGYILAHG